MSGLAAAVSAVTGADVGYTDVPLEQFAAILEGAGLPAPVAGMFADIDRSVAAGDLHVEGDDLEELIGRAPTPLRDAIAAAAGHVQG
jgi:NAD(P)H dehydrogenase (quinone)